MTVKWRQISQEVWTKCALGNVTEMNESTIQVTHRQKQQKTTAIQNVYYCKSQIFLMDQDHINSLSRHCHKLRSQIFFSNITWLLDMSSRFYISAKYIILSLKFISKRTFMNINFFPFFNKQSPQKTKEHKSHINPPVQISSFTAQSNRVAQLGTLGEEVIKPGAE